MPAAPLLVATGNAGKLAEFRGLLPDLEVLSPADVGLEDLEVEETADTFCGNARLKAQAFAGAAGLIAVADDSGLEVDALDGAPGVRSARYGGPGLDDAGRCQHLLQALRAVPPAERTARFRCCLVALAPDGRAAEAEGTCEGRILESPAGSGGFGYDPLFLYPPAGCSLAELTREAKAAISHRGRALRTLVPLLGDTFPELRAPKT